MTIVIDRPKPTFQWFLDVVEEFATCGVANIETAPNKDAVSEAANVLAILPRFYKDYDIIVRMKRPSKVKAWRISDRNNGTIALTVDHDIKYKEDKIGNLSDLVLFGCDCPNSGVHGKFSVSCQGVREETTQRAIKRDTDLFNILDSYLPEPKGVKFDMSYMGPPGQKFAVTIPFQRQNPVEINGPYEKYGVLESNSQLNQKTWHAIGDALFAYAWGGWTALGFEVLSGQKDREVLLKAAKPKQAEKIEHHLPMAINGCYEMMRRVCVYPNENFSKWRETFNMPAEHEGYFVAQAIHGLGSAVRVNAEALVDSYNENYARHRGISLLSAEQLKNAVDINFAQHSKSKELENSIFHRTVKRIS